MAYYTGAEFGRNRLERGESVIASYQDRDSDRQGGEVLLKLEV